MPKPRFWIRFLSVLQAVLVVVGLTPATTRADEAPPVVGASGAPGNRTGCSPGAPDGCLEDTPGLNDSSGPIINVWHGLTQTFGQIGRPQPWVNILGNVSDPDGVDWLTYSLNSGQLITITVGPDTRRLAALGDFNADIATTSLINGANQVVFTARDNIGNQSTSIVTVQYNGNLVWPKPYSIDWATATTISDKVQVVDGLWTKEADSIRPQVLGYDRLVAVGDLTWDDYEIVAPITIHSTPSTGYDPPSNGPGVGFILRWSGHYDWGPQQPEIGWYPLGMLGWYRWLPTPDPPGSTQRFQFIGGNDGLIKAQDFSGRTLTVGPQYSYNFKMRVETLPNQGGYYSLKAWQVGQPEPRAWDLTTLRPLSEPQQGSALLVAHHVDASFGDVAVASGPFTGSAIAADDFNAFSLNLGRWTVTDPQQGGPGQSTISIVNPYTDDARLSIAIPGGISHDIWTDVNQAPRVMQSIADTDFDIEVKFDSPVSAATQMQGVLVEQDSQNFLRFDIHYSSLYSDGARARLFAAKFENGTPTQQHNIQITGGQNVAPLYMRVRRAGDTWLHSYSLNGQTWTSATAFTHALNVTKAGVFAGNAGSNPAHTALFDYVFNTVAPLAGEDSARPIFLPLIIRN